MSSRGRHAASSVACKTYTCRKCGQTKNVSGFHRELVNGVQVGWRSPCKDCTNERNRTPENRAKKAEIMRRKRRADPRKAWGAHLRKYRITPDEYEALASAQNGVCAICGGVSPKKRRLSVDHDHTTGEVRGLLCQPCNVGLGVFGDSPDALRNAVKYVSKIWLKLECGECGYTVRTTRKWIDVGMPVCPCGETFVCGDGGDGEDD